MSSFLCSTASLTPLNLFVNSALKTSHKNYSFSLFPLPLDSVRPPGFYDPVSYKYLPYSSFPASDYFTGSSLLKHESRLFML